MSYIETTKNLGYSQVKTVITDPATNLATSQVLDVDYEGDGVVDNRDSTTFTYNASGQMIGQHTLYSYGAGAGVSYENWIDWTYNDSGKLATETAYSPDWSGDGYADNKSIRSFTYNDAGLVVSDEKIFFYDAYQSQSDYRLVTTTYTAAGLPDVTTVDDWSSLDFVVAEDRDYDAQGRITQISQMDPFDYGDGLFHPEQKWTYNPDGSVDHSNVSWYSPYGSFAEVTTKLTYFTPTHSKELVEGHNSNGDVTFRMWEEKWENKNGEVTDILRNHDVNLDGLCTPGSKSGYQDFRDRERLAYSDFDHDGDRDLVSHTVDSHLDKVIDYSMSIALIDDALLV